MVAVGCAVAAVLMLPSARGSAAGARLRALSSSHPLMRSSSRAKGRVTPAILAAGMAGLAVAFLLGGPHGVVGGVVVAFALNRWLDRLEPRAIRRRRAQLAAELPGTAELLAACLTAGCSPEEAAATVAQAVGGPVGEELSTVVGMLRLGGDPAASWAALGREPALAPLARSWSRALDTGAPLADSMLRLADEQRAVRRWAAEAQARRVGVRAAAPLGLCFLPAFVLIGVVPAIAGIASSVFSGKGP
jgi:Flp pilus assembly protein TadB